jgi:hypothetical protein
MYRPQRAVRKSESAKFIKRVSLVGVRMERCGALDGAVGCDQIDNAIVRIFGHEQRCERPENRLPIE